MFDARWLYLALPLVVAGCHSRSNARAGEGALTAADLPAGPAPAQAERMPRCPNVVPGSTTVVTEVADGIELRVTAPGDGQNEIRRRASALAAAADESRGKHQAHGGMNAQFGRCPVVMRNTRVTTREIPGGAAIVVKPSSAAELGWLRREVEERAAQLPAPKPFGPGLLKSCPNAVPGSETVVVDKPYGVDVRVLAPTAEGAKTIRDRTRDLATRPPGRDDRCPTAIADATLTPTEMHGGVTIAIKAKRPEDVAMLRREVRERSTVFAPPMPTK